LYSAAFVAISAVRRSKFQKLAEWMGRNPTGSCGDPSKPNFNCRSQAVLTIRSGHGGVPFSNGASD
jgi:hypothetical protein